ncbi:MAG TPA: DUF4258 domain-containing protein [Acidimicrobiia bacterium]|nr:DUF4258 domain-containing protein [Acidimicrobiia bacterium]
MSQTIQSTRPGRPVQSVRFTRHALDRLAERGVAVAEVERALRRPLRRYPGRPSCGGLTTVFESARVRVVCGDHGIVLTVIPIDPFRRSR